MSVRLLSLLSLLLLVCSVSAQNVTITSTNVPTYNASPKALIIEGSGQQSITFTNNSGATIGIQFVPNPVYPSLVVFNNIASLSPHGTNAQMPQVANGSVNYYVVVGATQYGPYAIQVGSGPLYVSVSHDNATGEVLSSPNWPVIPAGGTLEVVSSDYNYSVSWTGTDPFTPPLTSIGVGVSNNSPVQAPSTTGTYDFQIGIPGENGIGTGRIVVTG